MLYVRNCRISLYSHACTHVLQCLRKYLKNKTNEATTPNTLVKSVEHKGRVASDNINATQLHGRTRNTYTPPLSGNNYRPKHTNLAPSGRLEWQSYMLSTTTIPPTIAKSLSTAPTNKPPASRALKNQHLACHFPHLSRFWTEPKHPRTNQRCVMYRREATRKHSSIFSHSLFLCLSATSHIPPKSITWSRGYVCMSTASRRKTDG